jgi:hypothetical protein
VRTFQSVSFRHVKRVLNEAAHCLAKSLKNVDSSFTFHSFLNFIHETIYIDVVYNQGAVLSRKKLAQNDPNSRMTHVDV